MDTFLSKLQECGHTFEDVGNNRSIKLDELFKPERLSEIEQIVKKENWPVEINRSVWTVYDDQDYESAPLWALAFTDIWIDAVDFSSKCSVCGREHIKGDSDVQVPSVKSKRPILYVNGQFVIVDNVARDAIEAQLTGAHFPPFDEKGQYHYLLADIDLGSLVIKDDEVIGYSGDCPETPAKRGQDSFSESACSGQAAMDVLRALSVLRGEKTSSARAKAKKESRPFWGG